MKIQINKGVGILTTENSKELTVLMQIYTRFQEKGEGMFYKEKVVLASIHKPAKEEKKRTTYTRTCAVDGCTGKAKGVFGMQMHMLRSHGITNSGERVEFYKLYGKNMPIPKPVMHTGTNTYKLKQEATLSSYRPELLPNLNEK